MARAYRIPLDSYDDDAGDVSLRPLFNRIPDDVVLSVTSRDLEMGDARTCLCGWALRESLARTQGRPADDIDPEDEEINPDAYVPAGCAARFGGREAEWDAVFGGVTYSARLPIIERAWVDRVDRAVQRANGGD